MNTEHCIICGKFTDGNELVCERCESQFWKDEEAILDYFHFCGVPATIEQIREMMKA